MEDHMTRRIALTTMAVVVAVVLAWSTVGRAQLPRRGTALVCLHDEASAQIDRTRKDQARALLKAINAAEGRAVQTNRQYAALSQLRGLPASPDGFELRL